ncbi:hypothetical protein LDHU3_25.0120:CDS1 [Leishmania donovani]|uniref:Hypothetical_protein n=1 Tax=Leishmania donovani TaxID=5661 RepID=A0A6J8FFR3_LEIDO|nr:hypothetical protein LDHU3_25.0120:CDS1 [Leishmania donovani]VDZ45197.1 hypothetical_protein [Leishmania donovani]
MFRRLSAIPVRWTAGAVSGVGTSAMASGPRAYAAKGEEQMDDAEFEVFEDDLWFLDELCDENVGDLFSYIPSSDATLLGHDEPPSK